MAAKGAAPVMILAMNVIGDGTSSGDELGTGRNGQKPASRHHNSENFGQRDTSLAAQQSRLFVKRDKALQMTDVKRNSPRDEAAITIATSIGVGKDRLFKCRQVWDIAQPIEGLDVSRFDGGVPPPRLIGFCCIQKRHRLTFN